jgi:nucleotide-binding universal stress UspA family protein
VDLAEELEADLVVMGGRGLGAVKRLVVGSVSEGVVSLAPSPVLVMRGGEGAWPPTRIVVGADLSEEARKASELAMSFTKRSGEPFASLPALSRGLTDRSTNTTHPYYADARLTRPERSSGGYTPKNRGLAPSTGTLICSVDWTIATVVCFF